MTNQRKTMLLQFLDTEIERAKENAKKADEASKFVMSGPSQSGDKYHAENAANLAQSYVKRLEKLKTEIDRSKEEISAIAKAVSFIQIEYEDRSRLDFYLVGNAASLTRFLFLSENSPLGAAVLGKRIGDSFSYVLNNNESQKNFSGRIVNIE